MHIGDSYNYIIQQTSKQQILQLGGTVHGF